MAARADFRFIEYPVYLQLRTIWRGLQNFFPTISASHIFSRELLSAIPDNLAHRDKTFCYPRDGRHTATLRSELRSRISTDGYFLWSSAFIELSSLQSIVEGQKACRDRETHPKLLVSSKF